MKPTYLLALTVLTACMVWVLAFNKPPSVAATQPAETTPAIAPSPSAGSSPDLAFPTPKPLPDPLATPGQALSWLRRYDTATWDQAWSLETLTLQPSRITISLFASWSATGDGQFAPGADDAIGPVWKITIRGNVHPHGLTAANQQSAGTYSGMTYLIAQRSGIMLSAIAWSEVPGITALAP